MLRVTFIHQSSFVVETDTKQIVFDYFPASAIREPVFHGKEPLFSADKPLYVFASNCHGDHFSTEVLKWAEERETHYFFSSDIRPVLGKGQGQNIKYLGPNASCEINGVRVTTLRSNDAGVAFIVETDGLTIYHAGDLSVWNVDSDGNRLYADLYGGGYKRQIRGLENRHIDIGFVVLDPRIGAGAYKGIEYFLTHVDCDLVFPMGCWEDYRAIESFRRLPQIVRLKDKVISIDRDNIIFNID